MKTPLRPGLLKKLTLKQRIWLFYVLLITIAISVTGTMSYFIAADIVKKNAFRQSQNTLDTTAQVLDEKLKRTMVSVMSMTISDAFRRMLTDAALNDYSRYYSHMTAMGTIFDQARVNEPLIDSILVYTPIGEFYSTVSRRRPDTPFLDTGLFQRIKDKPSAWVEGHADPLFSQGEQVVSFILDVGLENKSVEKVYLIVNLKESGLVNNVTANTLADGSRLFFLNREGETVMNSGQPFPAVYHEPEFMARLANSPNLKGNFEYRVGEQDYLVNYSGIQVVTGWQVVGLQSKAVLLKELEAIQYTTILIAAGCLLLALLASNLLAGYLLTPLLKLSLLMRRVEMNDLSVRFHSDYQDEVTQVGSRFNRMLDQISILIEEVRRVEGEKRSAEIKALSAQIDPHFLYNTLNTVYWKTQMNELKDVQEMVLSLSQLFQLGLNKGKEMTRVEQEIAHVKLYLALQKQVYEQLFDYSVEVSDEELLDLPIPRVILQPLVENSILHGFKNMRAGGLVSVRAWKEKESLVLEVADNGKGMDIASIREQLRPEELIPKGYALRNVYQRLRLYYGARAEIVLYSDPGIRTSVTLKLPLNAYPNLEV